jgi:hypothetical protein
LANAMQISYLDAEQGRIEQQTELYIVYSEGAAENLTQLCAKSSGRVFGSAKKQDTAVWSLL